MLRGKGSDKSAAAFGRKSVEDDEPTHAFIQGPSDEAVEAAVKTYL